MDVSVLRILDANSNRCREGLRVMEEHARLVLEDRALTERIKRLRHELAAASAALGLERALGVRDVEHDVGTGISTEQERHRGQAADVARAAAKRVSEALRCLEEYGKLARPEVSERVEALRYEAYALEQQLLVAGPLRQRLRAARLHVLLTEALCRRDWRETAQAAMAGGAEVIQLREKLLSDAALLERARELRELTRRGGAMLFINDRADLARLAEADGVHVGRSDLPVRAAREIGGASMLVGASAHSVEEVEASSDDGPDYVAVGPMHASKTKPQAAVRGPELLMAAAARTELPIVAIGGIDAGRAAALRAKWEAAVGAARPLSVAVCQAVIAADDPREAARAIREATGSDAPGDRRAARSP